MFGGHTVDIRHKHKVSDNLSMHNLIWTFKTSQLYSSDWYNGNLLTLHFSPGCFLLNNSSFIDLIVATTWSYSSLVLSITYLLKALKNVSFCFKHCICHKMIHTCICCSNNTRSVCIYVYKTSDIRHFISSKNTAQYL